MVSGGNTDGFGYSDPGAKEMVTMFAALSISLCVSLLSVSLCVVSPLLNALSRISVYPLLSGDIRVLPAWHPSRHSMSAAGNHPPGKGR